jgi:hypothetical protein
MTDTDKSHLLFMASKMRERAQEALVMAEAFRDPEARRVMFEVAESYEKLALRLELAGGEHRAPLSPTIVG